MVSELVNGSAIINLARTQPNKGVFENRKTPTNKMVLDGIMNKYFAGRYFYFDKKWYLSPKRTNKEGDDKLYHGSTILDGARKTPNKILFKRKHSTRTYQQAYDEILNEIVARRQFYHRGKGNWCMYDKKKDKVKQKNIKHKNSVDPLTGAMNHAGQIGYTTWNPNTKTGFASRSKAHMGDGIKYEDENGKIVGRR